MKQRPSFLIALFTEPDNLTFCIGRILWAMMAGAIVFVGIWVAVHVPDKVSIQEFGIAALGVFSFYNPFDACHGLRLKPDTKPDAS